MRSIRSLLDFVVLAAFAIWQGGFTFYVSIVVPIGTDVLGSARAQGEITQRVTDWLNLVTAMGVALMLVHFLFTRSAEGSTRDAKPRFWRGRLLELSGIIVVASCAVVLVALHPKLDQLLEYRAGRFRVSDRETFYQLHRGYLWISTLQWLAGWIWLSGFLSRIRPSIDRCSR